jgi:hypothetical protein
MAAIFSVGSKVTVTAKSPVPVAGHGGDHTGKTGKVRGYTDLSPKSGDIIHIIDLDEPFMVPNETPNPQAYGPQGMLPHKIHGVDRLPDQEVTWIEVPASCLS